MVIYILGDIDFSYRILLGVTMLYQDSAMHLMAAVLLILFVLWSFVKWTLNPEKSPYPFKEFAFGIIFYMIFGGLGAVSPTFDVRLETDVYQGQTFQARIINDVPLLAAVPAWLATNLFKGMRETLSPILVIPGTNIYPGMSQGIDPLTMLVKLNDISYQTSLDPHLELTIKEYASKCYTRFHENGGNPANQSIQDLMSKPVDQFWADTEVDVNWMFSKTYSEANPNGVDNTCKDVFDYVTGELPGYQAKIQLHLSANNIQSTDISSSTDLIMSSLTGGAALSPYTFMTGKFVAANFAEGMNTSDVPKMQMWAKKMMFEASQKRVFERAGEANLFSQIMIPMITAIEAFAFFIAPVLMLLTVMGGAGITYIGKYLMLTLFINMWSFIKIFTDFFMLLTVHKGINGDLTVNDNYHPFSMVNQNYTFMELENYLAIASSLTASIPLFAMFLLYGGVHSMMGVMRGMQGGGVDASNLAPTIGTSMNAGTAQLADQRWSQINSTGLGATGTDAPSAAKYGNTSVMKSISRAGAQEYSQANSQLTAAQNSVNTSFDNLFQTTAGSGTSTSDSETQQFGVSAGSQQVNSLADAVNKRAGTSTNNSTSAVSRLAAALALQLSAGGGGKTSAQELDRGEAAETVTNAASKMGKPFKLGGDLSAFVAAQYQQGNGEALEKQISQALNFINSDSSGEQYSNGFDWSTATVSNDTASHAETWKELQSNMNSYTRQSANVQTLKDSYSQSGGVGTSYTIPWTVAEQPLDVNGSSTGFVDVFNGATKDTQDAILSHYGASDVVGLATKVAFDSGTGNKPDFTSAKMLQTMTSSLVDKEAFLPAADILENTAPYVGAHGGGFKPAVQELRQLDAYNKITDQVESDIVKPTVSTDTSQAVGDQGKQQEVKDKNTTAETQTAKQGNSAITKANNLINQDGTLKTQTSNVGASIPITKEDKQEIKNAQENLETQTPLENRTLKAGAELAKSVMSGVDSFVGLFQGTDQAWGENAGQWSSTVAALANNGGYSSGVLKQGLSDLYTMGADERNELSKQVAKGNPEAIAQLSAMNDASIFLSNSGELGKSAISAMSDEREVHVKTGASWVNDQVKGLDQENGLSTDQFNAVSTARMNGDITDANATTLLSLGQKEDDSHWVQQGMEWGGWKVTNDELKSTLFSASYGPISQNEDLSSIITQSNQEFAPRDTLDEFFGFVSSEDYTSPSNITQMLKDEGRQSELYNDYRNEYVSDTVSNATSAAKVSNALTFDSDGNFEGVNMEVLSPQNSATVAGNYVDTLLAKNDDGSYKTSIGSLNEGVIGIALDDKGYDSLPTTGNPTMAYIPQRRDESNPAYTEIRQAMNAVEGAGNSQQNASSLAYLSAGIDIPALAQNFEGLEDQDISRVINGLTNLKERAFDSGVVIDSEKVLATPLEFRGEVEPLNPNK